ncbi:hypothetical protein [Cyanobium sp. ATX 6F1]|uniref:hypothetical protein n=1 Tax=Cyanobium sp. ATX 6F1 TaxID=2823702 RepID=UPI0020CEF839|nr:hypothetical protein [Cyanobium sp. ATX 6F1]
MIQIQAQGVGCPGHIGDVAGADQAIELHVQAGGDNSAIAGCAGQGIPQRRENAQGAITCQRGRGIDRQSDADAIEPVHHRSERVADAEPRFNRQQVLIIGREGRGFDGAHLAFQKPVAAQGC